MRTPECLKKIRTHAIIVTRGETRRTGEEFHFLARHVCSREASGSERLEAEDFISTLGRLEGNLKTFFGIPVTNQKQTVRNDILSNQYACHDNLRKHDQDL